MQKKEIYYVEDDADIAAGVKEYLEGRGFAVHCLPTIAAARQAFLKRCPDLLLLDWNMPDGSGVEFCEYIRRKWNRLPIILLTVKGVSKDVITGFQKGADDYVIKPFELEILDSRISALLRRVEGEQEQRYLCCDAITLDQEKVAVWKENAEITLSPLEYQLLLLLLRNKGRTVTRDSILEQVWDSNGNYVNNNTLTVTMKRLREKLGMPVCIKTVRSFGYRMEDTV